MVHYTIYRYTLYYTIHCILQVRAVTGYGDRVQASQASEADLRDLTVKMTNMAGMIG